MNTALLELDYGVGVHASAWNNKLEAERFIAKMRDLFLQRKGLRGNEPFSYDCTKSYPCISQVLSEYGISVGWLDYVDYSYGLAYSLGEWSGDLQALIEAGIICPLDITTSDKCFKEFVKEWKESDYYDEEEVSYWLEHEETLDELRQAFNACGKGDYDKAMGCYVFSKLIDWFSESLGIPKKMAFDNTAILLTVLFDDANGYNTYVSYHSKEVYFYNQYKDRLPEDLRRKYDSIVGCFLNPFGVEDDSMLTPFTYYDDSEKECYIVATMHGSCEQNDEVDEHDLKMFFREAVDVIVNHLPELRKDYGNA